MITSTIILRIFSKPNYKTIIDEFRDRAVSQVRILDLNDSSGQLGGKGYLVVKISFFYFQDLVTRLIILEPDKRLTAKQALDHPWVQVKKGIFVSFNKHFPFFRNSGNEDLYFWSLFFQVLVQKSQENLQTGLRKRLYLIFLFE